jgi:catechol 2,3-dioxygenase-like lactoylglutathione lyase family enzyme
MTPSVRALSHTAFNVRDLDAAVAFYADVLGLEKAFEVRVPEFFATTGHPFAALVGEVGIVYIRLGNRNFLELFRSLPDTDPATGGPNTFAYGFTHICLEVSELTAFVDELRGKGVTIDEEVKLGPDGSYQAWIRDPDGNRIELMEYTPESLQTRFL